MLAHIERVVALFNGTRGEPRSFDNLDALLSAQPYRLAYWRVAAEEINYRRFFDINELAAIRVEDPAVFERTHAFAFALLAAGEIDGFRIDHVDGLYDPGDYLHRLQARARELRPDVYTVDRPLYVVVEKILGIDEELPAVAGGGHDRLRLSRARQRHLRRSTERAARSTRCTSASRACGRRFAKSPTGASSSCCA